MAACAAKLVLSSLLRAANGWEAFLPLDNEPGSPALLGSFECPGGALAKLKVGISERPDDEDDDDNAGYLLIFEAGLAVAGRRAPDKALGMEFSALKAKSADLLAHSLNVAGAVSILNRQLDKKLALADPSGLITDLGQLTACSEGDEPVCAWVTKKPKA